MDPSLTVFLIGGLSLVFLVCVVGLIGDLRSGRSRLAHEGHDNHRDVLPLNYWLGVGSKGAGALLALSLLVVTSLRMI